VQTTDTDIEIKQLRTVTVAKAGRNGKSVDQQVFERQATICKAFANPVRLHLLDLLGKGEWVVGDLQQELGISKANLSQHLTILRSAGVIVTQRNGKQVICSLAIPEIKQACTLIRNVLKAQVRATKDLV
jgi:DNA-binding transcriptional ArsR family regulator